jgi:hypothetical protein
MRPQPDLKELLTDLIDAFISALYHSSFMPSFLSVWTSGRPDHCPGKEELNPVDEIRFGPKNV